MYNCTGANQNMNHLHAGRVSQLTPLETLCKQSVAFGNLCLALVHFIFPPCKCFNRSGWLRLRHVRRDMSHSQNNDFWRLCATGNVQAVRTWQIVAYQETITVCFESNYEWSQNQSDPHFIWLTFSGGNFSEIWGRCEWKKRGRLNWLGCFLEYIQFTSKDIFWAADLC